MNFFQKLKTGDILESKINNSNYFAVVLCSFQKFRDKTQDILLFMGTYPTNEVLCYTLKERISETEISIGRFISLDNQLINNKGVNKETYKRKPENFILSKFMLHKAKNVIDYGHITDDGILGLYVDFDKVLKYLNNENLKLSSIKY